MNADNKPLELNFLIFQMKGHRTPFGTADPWEGEGERGLHSAAGQQLPLGPKPLEQFSARQGAVSQSTMCRLYTLSDYRLLYHKVTPLQHVHICTF